MKYYPSQFKLTLNNVAKKTKDKRQKKKRSETEEQIGKKIRLDNDKTRLFFICKKGDEKEVSF